MGWLIDPVVEPLRLFAFMRYGVAAAAIIGVSASVLSCLLVVRRQALLGDAIAHATLLGVVVGYLVAGRIGVFWGALASGVLTGAAIAYVERNSRVKEDAAMGILFTAAFALGLAIMSVARPRGIDLNHVLLGNILGVDGGDLALTAVAGGLALSAVVVLFRPLQLWSFDPVSAEALGLPVRTLHYLFMAMLSATIVASLQAVGLVLVIAMLITPGSTALLLTDRLRTMMLVAAVVGVVSGVGGLYGSYYLDVASGPSMVLVATTVFGLAFLFAPTRGVVTSRRQRRRLSLQASEEDVLKAAANHSVEHGEDVSLSQLAARNDAPTEPMADVVGRLVRQGLVTLGGGGGEVVVVVTEAGLSRASELVRRHRLLERYLHDAERVPFTALHDEADWREHRTDRSELDHMDRVLGHPEVDPHGHPIPPPAGVLRRIAGRPLSKADGGTRWRVLAVSDDDEALLIEMVNLGVTPDTIVDVGSRIDDGLLTTIAGQQVQLPARIADRITATEVASGP